MEVNKTDMQIVFQVEEQQGQRLRDRSVPGMFKELSESQWSWSGVSKGKSIVPKVKGNRDQVAPRHCENSDLHMMKWGTTRRNWCISNVI